MSWRWSRIVSRLSPIVAAVPSAERCVLSAVVGTGVLSLPAGMGRLSETGASSSEVLTLATLATVLFGAINAASFLLIGDCCKRTGQASYVGAWKGIMGPQAAFLPALASLLLCFTARRELP